MHEEQSFADREGLEHYSQQFEANDWNEDDLQSEHVDLKDKADRLIEYADKKQLRQQVVRMAAANLQGDARILNFDFEVKSLPKRESATPGALPGLAMLCLSGFGFGLGLRFSSVPKHSLSLRW